MAITPRAPTRRQWTVYLSWAQQFPGWERCLRRYIRECRETGLTKFDVRAVRGSVIKIQAMRPDAVWEPVA